MNEEQKTLADKWVEKAKNNHLIAGIVVITTVVGIVATGAQQIAKVLPLWPKKTTDQGTTQCRIDSRFAADVLYSDARVLKKNTIAAALESFGYKGRTVNTGFEEYDKPGAAGTAWITYPSCLGESDPRLAKIVKIMKQNSYSEKTNNLTLIPHSSKDFPVVETSLF